LIYAIYSVEPALPAGEYMAADASLKIKVNLAFPLLNSAGTQLADQTVAQPSTQVCCSIDPLWYVLSLFCSVSVKSQFM